MPTVGHPSGRIDDIQNRRPTHSHRDTRAPHRHPDTVGHTYADADIYRHTYPSPHTG